MKIYIEIVIIFIFLSILITWKLWNRISKKNAIKKYKPENDKSRKGGVLNTGTIRTDEQGIDSKLINLVGLEQPEGREFLQETTISDAGTNSPGPRKNSKDPRRLFGKK